MEKLKSLEALNRLRAEFQDKVSLRLDVGTTIAIGMGTCGIAAGAREVMHAILEELESRDVQAHVTTVGCVGMCEKEPLVEIHRADEPPVTYGNITPAKAPRLVDEHLVKGQTIEEWVVQR
ncbi:MAG TPA: (2Fe-2S) ferredoxin domain-containing protein [Chloroflexi bacterium]|nr:(2Fe-2S) ferredoxin domain-containing protein [Chloroflexota bacterium]